MRKTTKLLTVTAAAAAFAFMAGDSAPIPSAEAQMVDGPKVTWRVSLWGKRRAFTESLEFISKTVSERTGGRPDIAATDWTPGIAPSDSRTRSWKAT